MSTTNYHPNDPTKTLSAWTRLDIIDAPDIESFIPIGSHAIIALREGADWSSIFGDKITQQCVDAPNNSYEHTISCLLAGRSNLYDTKFDEMKQQRFIVRLHDANGDTYVAGCPDEPLRFSFDNCNDGDDADGAAYSITFHCVSRLPLLAATVSLTRNP